MGEIRIMNRRGNKNRFPSNTTIQSTETANTVETIPETPSTPIQIQEASKMKMTYTEIKNALSEGKTLFRVGKDKSTTEVRMIDNKPVRRYISEAGVSTAWSATALNTMPKYEWESKESEELPPSELTAPVTRQVQLGDGTSTIVTEYVPISEAPVVIDPFAIPLTKDNDTPEPEPEPEVIPESIPEPVQEDVARHIPEVEEEEEEERMPFTLSPMLAITEMRTGHQVLWVPLKEDNGLQVMYYRDTDGKFKEIRANSKHIYEEIDMNEFFQHVFVRVEEDYDSFVNCLSYISEQTTPCYMRNIVTGRIIRSPACEDGFNEETPLEVGTILPIELRTFWTVEFGEIE